MIQENPFQMMSGSLTLLTSSQVSPLLRAKLMKMCSEITKNKNKDRFQNKNKNKNKN